MHSMHQVQAMHNGTIGQQHLQQQNLNVAPSSSSSGQQQEQTKQLNMTVLETLEPAQPTQLESVQQQQTMIQQQQQGPQQQTVIHHLVPTPAPLLHQLQPSSRQMIDHQQQQQQQLEMEQQQAGGIRDENAAAAAMQQHQAGHNQRQSRAQIEGIASDSGRPIVQWLTENYEVSDGESLPRSTVYNHYLAHCRRLRMSSVNAASFGKLIRSVFLGLKTRRLGTRGHSKYHYFGVRAKQHVRFDWLQEVGDDRAGCSSAMLRDSNDTNSNGSDGNCGSETDSTGNCSGRLSTSISGTLSTSNGGGAVAAGNKRLKRSSSSAHDDYQNLQQGALEHVNNLDHDLNHRHQHLQHLNQQQQQPQLHHHHHHHLQQDHQAQQHQQQIYEDPPASNGMYHLTSAAYPVNGYDKQDSFACAAQWPSLDQYDLSSLRNHLGPNKSTLVYDNWPQREPGLLERQVSDARARQTAADGGGKGNISMDQTLTSDLACLVEPFENQYKLYYKRMVELLGELQFGDVEHLWSEFWRPQAQPGTTSHWITGNDAHPQAPEQALAYQSNAHANNNQQQQHQTVPFDSLLTFEQLYELTSQRAIIERINQIDYSLLSAIEGFLVVDMLSPLPRPLVQHLRAFARNICLWTEAAIKDYHPSFVSEKIRSTRAFEHALRRYTSINHLSTASRAIWNKRSVLAQMSIDLSRLDLRDIEHQVASLMSQEKFVEPTDDDGGNTCGGNRMDSSSNLLQSTELQHHTPQGPNGGVSDRSPQQSPTVSQASVNDKTSANGAPSSASDHSHNVNDNIENNYTASHHNSNNGGADNQQERTSISTSNGCSRAADNFAAPNIKYEFSPMQPAQLVRNFLHLLEDPYPANAWPEWCRTLVESRVCGQSYDEARNFILKWNFYISLIMRELTLRSAPSLGSLQLIRLLFDEYMYYLVVSKLAQVQNKTSTELLRTSSRFANI